MSVLKINPVTGLLDLAETTVGAGTVTSVAGGVGITNTPEPIVGAGTVDLDIFSLTTEAGISSGDWLAFVDVSVGTAPSAQRKATLANLVSAINGSLDHGLLTGLADDDHLQYLLLAGRAGTANNPLLSTTVDGTITGSSAAAAALRLNATTSGTPGDVLFNSGISSITGIQVVQFAGVDGEALTIGGTDPTVIGLSVGSKIVTAHSAWTYDSTGGIGANIFGYDFTPRIQTNAAVTRTLPLVEGYRCDPEMMVGSAGTFNITDFNSWSEAIRFDRLGATGSVNVTVLNTVRSQPSLNTGATVLLRRGLYFAAPAGSGGTQSSAYGLDVEDQAVTAEIAAVRSALSADSTKFFLRSTGAAQSVVVGNVRLGDTTAPTQKLEVLGNALLDNAGTASELRLREPSASGSSYTGFKSPALVANLIYEMPGTFPTVNGQVLSGTTAGVLSWATAAAGTVTSVAGGVGITNSPEPIVGAGTVDLDINSLATEAALANGDLFAFVDVSVGTTPSSQRKAPLTSIVARVNGSSGAAGGILTLQNLTADSADVTTTTLSSAIMSTTGVGAGTWKFKYTLICQCDVTTQGIGFGVNHTGTVGQYQAILWTATTATLTLTGVADSNTTAPAGQGIEGKQGGTLDAVIGSTFSGADAVDTDYTVILEGIIVVTATGTLELKINTENAGSAVRVMADSCLELLKVE